MAMLLNIQENILSDMRMFEDEMFGVSNDGDCEDEQQDKALAQNE